MAEWNEQQENYLKALSKACEQLAGRYKMVYNAYEKRETWFKIPSIVLSSVTSLLSFGNSNFQTISHQLNITVGIISIFITIINSIEAYLKISQIMSGAALASCKLTQLKEKIDLELSIERSDRANSGIVFLRECYSEFEKIEEIAPNVLKKNRYVRPEQGEIIIEVSGSESDTPKKPSCL
jgi:hypothetical protein